MSIKIIDRALWSKRSWELSFKKTIELEDILPKEGNVYPIVFDGELDPSNFGELLILWKPPHSELNGWLDKRPSEILSSYVLVGDLRYRNGGKEEYEFSVFNRTRLVEQFEKMQVDIASPFSQHTLESGKSVLYWDYPEHISRSAVGKYTCVNAVGCLGVHLEVILSRVSERICIHYSSLLHEYFSEEALIAKYYLNSDEQLLFEGILDSAEVIIDQSMGELPENLIYGAEYW